MEFITSAQNPKIKNLLLLQEKSRERKEQGLFVVEGRRELEHCIEAGYTVHTVFYCPEIADIDLVDSPTRRGKNFSSPKKVEENLFSLTPLAGRANLNLVEIPASLYRKVAYRDSTEGIIAEVEAREHGLSSLELPENPLIVVLEAVEKPGNLGAVLRSADAAGASAVIICDPLTDLYNPNLIRASIGAVFTVPVASASSAEVIAWLKERGIAILTAQLQDSLPYYGTDMTGPVAIVMGTESTGLTQPWREAATSHIRIPMLGRLDSLNVSVSAALLLFEAVRQRQGSL